MAGNQAFVAICLPPLGVASEKRLWPVSLSEKRLNARREFLPCVSGDRRYTLCIVGTSVLLRKHASDRYLRQLTACNPDVGKDGMGDCTPTHYGTSGPCCRYY